MDQRTVEVYQKLALEKIKCWQEAKSNLDEVIDVAFKNSKNVLDIGFGSGRDSLYLSKNGFEVYGVDPCQAFVDEMKKIASPDKKERFCLDSLPLLSSQGEKDFYDTIVCNAVLMHLIEDEMFEAVFSLKKILKPSGKLFISIPEKMEGIDPKSNRTSEGLLYNLHSPYRIASIFSPLGFIMVYKKRSQDRLNRQARIWVTMIFELDEKS